MWQQQSQSMFSNNLNESKTYGNYMFTEHNKISYERNPNQQQYASYPRDAIYHHASGPGWSQQQVFYPANLFK